MRQNKSSLKQGILFLQVMTESNKSIFYAFLTSIIHSLQTSSEQNILGAKLIMFFKLY